MAASPRLDHGCGKRKSPEALRKARHKFLFTRMLRSEAPAPAPPSHPCYVKA